jgi:hypothetical protein
MDWIKVKTNHILYEYNDLRDTEFVAWIKIMALTAVLEHEPTREQMLQYVNYQTLDSLSRKLHDHSTDLPSILHKVLMDVSWVSHRREALKKNSQRYRENKASVIDDVIMTSSLREDKIREDKNIIHTPLPPKGESSFDEFWKSYPKKVGKKAAQKAWSKAKDKPPIDSILKAISKQRQSDSWQRDGGQYIPNPATWINEGRWDDELGRGTGNRSAGPGTPIQAEYVGEIQAPISEAERISNLRRVRELMGQGSGEDHV